jgi:hypothetical protein
MVIAAVMPSRDAEEVVSIPAVLSTYLSESGALIPPTTRIGKSEVLISMWTLHYVVEEEYVLREFLHLALTQYANAAVNPPMTQGESHGKVVWDKSESEALFDYKPWGSLAGFNINRIEAVMAYSLTDYGEATGVERVSWEPRIWPMLITPAVIV